MQWDSSLECGIPVIDFEHKQLVAQVGRLTKEANAERAREILDFLTDYVVKHFAHEQVMHRSSRYPKAREHKAAHTAFLQAVSELDAEFTETHGSTEVLEKITRTLQDWLRDHIMGQDREFAEYYQALEPLALEKNPLV